MMEKAQSTIRVNAIVKGVLRFVTSAVVSIALLGSCSQFRQDDFPDVNCGPQGNSMSTNIVFKPCRTFTYSAKYWDEGYNLISTSLVRMTITGNEAPTGRENEWEAIVQYQFDPETIPQIDKYNLNNDFKGRAWITETVTTVKEDGYDTWITPFRDNQFAFTQVAPYPSVNLPLTTDKQWTSNLLIYGTWGDWDNQQLISNYLSLDEEQIVLPFQTITTRHVTSYVDTDFGRSTHDFWYNNEFGFVKMQYKNYQGQLLIFELQSVD